MLNRQFRKARCRIPMNIQFFAEAAGGGAGGSAGNGGGSAQEGQDQTQNQSQNGGQQQQAAQIDYAKIQQMLEGTLAAEEETALKAYFKQQGLSQQEAEQAMATFKAQKAASQPDVAAMQSQITQAQEAVKAAQIQNAATMAAVALGLDAKTIPYVLKMADLGQVMGQDGKINEETMKNALNKVLEDVPALKPQGAGSTGFVQVGTGGSSQNQAGAVDAELDRIFSVKKK